MQDISTVTTIFFSCIPELTSLTWHTPAQWRYLRNDLFEKLHRKWQKIPSTCLPCLMPEWGACNLRCPFTSMRVTPQRGQGVHERHNTVREILLHAHCVRLMHNVENKFTFSRQCSVKTEEIQSNLYFPTVGCVPKSGVCVQDMYIIPTHMFQSCQ